MRVYLESLGCRLNAAEIETLARTFAGAGQTVVSAPEAADVIVLNTCAVTGTASRKSRRRVRTLHRRAPQAAIAVTGCWATEAPSAAASLPAVRWVIPNAEKSRAVEHVLGQQAPPQAWEPGRWGHTRAFVGVQEGCDYACTYCITRLLRGPSHSRPPAEVLSEVRARVANGAQEVVLTGVSLGAYGHDLGLPHGLADLVALLLRETDLPRLRLSSVEPWDVDEALLAWLAHPRFCRQLHLPLQAGADATLRRMGRRITTDSFRRLAARAREIAPDVALTTDLIAGFPGESRADFEAGLAFVTEMAFARLHVFPYSPRPGTPSVRLPHPVPAAERRARAAQLRAVGERSAAAYRARFVGRTLPVLWERRNRAGVWQGLTDTYLPVINHAPQNLYNRITPTRLVRWEEHHFVGQMAAASEDEKSAAE